MEVHQHFKSPNCCICQSSFIVNGYSVANTYKTPFLLNCGHSACEKCLQTSLSAKNIVTCNVCKVITSAPSQFELNNMISIFPVNYFLLGMWHYRTSTLNMSDLDSCIKYDKPKSNKIKKKNKNVICHECMENIAEFHCKQCSVPYCSSCFKKVHLSARAFRSHTKVPLIDKLLNIHNNDSLMCSTHKEHKLEFYCNLCHSTICSRCMIEAHNGHTIEMLENVEVDYQEDFIQRYLKVSTVLDQMKSTKKKIEKIIHSNEDTALVKKINEGIFEFFLNIHGKLAVLQNHLHKQLSLADTSKQLEGLLEILNESVNSTEALLMSTKFLMADSSLQKTTKFICVIENMKSKEELPCYLIEAESKAPPRLVIDEDLLKRIEHLCSIELSSGDKFKLVKESELPPGYDIPPPLKLTREDVLELMNKHTVVHSDSSSVTSDHISERDVSPVLSSASDLSSSSRTKDILSNDTSIYSDGIPVECPIRARISHLVSPSEFYVQRECAMKKLYDFQSSLRQSYLQNSRPPKTISKGKIYLALYERDLKWYRARILEILGDRFKVLYIDFGNTECVPRGRIRELPKNCLNIPVLAYRCMLRNCFPRDENGQWKPEAVAFMAEIIDDDFVSMVVFEETPRGYVVDLYKVTGNSIISILHALVFQEYAAFEKATDVSVRNIMQFKQVLISLPKQNIQQGDILEVHVSHVSSPHYFYVQNLSSAKRLVKMSEELQRAYNIRNKIKNSIYDPKKGMYIAARYSKDLKWYRGKILECLEGKIIRVFFVDFGNEEDVSWENVKLLQSKFSSLSPQAIKCVLADVMPIENHEEWNDEVCTYFNKLVFNQKLKVVFESVDNDYSNVVLYRSQQDADICINALLVREKYAISTGVNSTVVEYPKVYSKLPDQDLFQCQVGIKETKKENHIFEPPKIDKSAFLASLVKGPNGSLRIHVYVKRIVSPGEFYITPTSFNNTLSLLETGLQKFYEQSGEYEDKEWSIEDRCAIKYEKKWYRAIILSFLENSKLKVSLPDEGLEVIGEKQWIRPLHNKFLIINDGVMRCHLGGLDPAQDTWSSLSSTEFKDFVNNHKDSLFICQMGEISSTLSSLPVELFTRVIKEAGPTEPNCEEWTSLNHYLRIIGLAKSDNMVQWDCEGNILNWKDLEIKSCAGSEEGVLHKLFSSSLTIYSAHDSQHEAENSDGNDQLDLTPTKEEISEPYGIVVPSTWLPPLPLKEFSFVAAPTYVDSDCVIYLHDFHQSSHLLEEISKALCTKYDNSLPKPYDATVQPGDLCVAKYHLDNKWYRAVLLDVKKEFDQYEIQFVDYGNVETCKLSELRKIPVTHHIPIQAIKCSFHELEPIDPSGKWNERHIEIIQFHIVDKNCQIKLLKLPDKDVYGIEKLKLPDGRNFIAEIVQEGFAKYKKLPTIKERDASLSIQSDKDSSESNEIDFKVVDILENNNSSNNSENEDISDVETNSQLEECIILSDEEQTLNFDVDKVHEKPKLIHWSSVIEGLPDELKPSLSYKELQIPPLLDTLIVEPTSFLTPTHLILHVTDVEEDPFILHKLSEFKELSETLQKEGPNQPLLSKPYKYKLCCAQFTDDKIWYRGIILDELPYDLVLIQYVDYGNVESLHASSVRELKAEWAKLEVLGLLGELDNISVNEGVPLGEALRLVSEALIAKGPLKAIVKERTPLKVNLYHKDKLAYEELICSRLLKHH